MDEATPILFDLPLRGRMLVQNSPARRIPSHGTTLFGTSHAVDLVPVDEHGRSAPRDVRSLVALEPPERFLGFGMPVLAPAAGSVVAAHDAEADHEARRSPFVLVPYALTQAERVREGITGLAGNHVVVALGPAGPFALIAHLRRGTLRVGIGETIAAGDAIGECGNSGNSTEPHVHVQLSDTDDWARARGVPFAFRRYRDAGGAVIRGGMPGEREVVEAV
ncbi:M23 family metallopeptidase [Agromyces archimandritae]|uniref:M23 family metallopeptidase n=1 Tax=Agromyces archimandritae TaxID=2781962 RepID=A0A975FNJ6_9MICO|nr:M23 family metallopeptidase [Agromyces archimandritae]QTX04937.1 M23 family metallopeptidase [Agromyces archimandritae]